MTVIEILSQVINAIGTSLNMIGVNIKNKNKTLIFFTLGNSCIAIALGLLNARAGMFVQITFVLETIINYFWMKKHRLYPLWLIAIYVIIPCTFIIATFGTIWDIFPMLGAIFFPAACLSKDLRLRILNFFAVVVWIPYDIVFRQYAGMISCIIFALVNLAAIIRIDILKK